MAATTAAELGIDADAVEDALARSLTFPARWYSDPAIYAFELEHVFAKSWQLVGSLEKLAEPGDHVVGHAGHVPVLVTRDLAGELHGFVNVCRHRAFPVATEDGNRKTLQCRYHAWTYELDGRLRKAPRSEREEHFDHADFSLLPVAVDTWGGFVWVNPDPEAPSLRESYPEFEPLAAERGLDFTGYRFYGRYEYEIPANWKVWVENATECYHCPTIHKDSFSDAFDADVDVYEYMNVGRLLGQFTPYNPRPRTYARNGDAGDRGFRFLYVWPASFFAQDDLTAFPGMIVPTGPESCRFVADMFVRPDADEAVLAEWTEMWNATLAEDAEVVRLQQPGLRSQMVPHGRLMPASESAISYFHRLVWQAFSEALERV